MAERYDLGLISRSNREVPGLTPLAQTGFTYNISKAEK